MNEAWHQWAEKKGYRVSFGAINQLNTAQKTLNELKSKNMINESFYKEWLQGFKYLKDIDTNTFKTLVMVAIPKAAYVIEFEYNGRSSTAIIPPTYVNYKSTFNKVLAEAISALGQDKHHFKLINAPLKTLAVLTGLAKYGRNNIVYVPEMGSYFQLVGLVTDMIMETENSNDMPNSRDNLNPQCEDCSACFNSCPTGAISEDRILLQAEKCYTLISETPGRLPDSPLPPSPQCIIGCLSCQQICPLNREKLNFKKTPFSLSETETSFLVHHFDPEAQIWTGIQQKFARLHLTELCEIFARNFQHLVKLSAK